MSKMDYLSEEVIKEYKAGNVERRVFLQTLKAALLQKSKDQGELSEQDEINILKNELKQRQQAKKEYEEAGRDDLVKKIDFEIAEIKTMLPEEMSEEEVEKIVREVIQSSEDKSFGSVMKLAMAKLQGRADGGLVSQIVRKVLG
jgi:hypothetical protein